MAVTIKKVAELAGVSTATVSRVINNGTGIRQLTRDKVLKAIASSGYRVNTIARSLKTNRTGIIGLITPEIANDFFMNIARSIEEYLKGFGYSLIICNTNESTVEEVYRAELLVEKCVDGVIVIPSSNSTYFQSPGAGVVFPLVKVIGFSVVPCALRVVFASPPIVIAAPCSNFRTVPGSIVIVPPFI